MMVASGAQLEKHGPAAEGPLLTAGPSALWARARLAWGAMQPNQRNWAIAVGVSLLASIALLTWFELRTDWKTLYSGLDPDDARQVGLTLTQAQIPFDVSDNGMTLRVPETQLDKARLA